MKGTREIVVVIPAYEPATNLINLVEDIKRTGFDTIIVVDDGSSHGCQSIFDTLSEMDGVLVLHHAVNLGKGAALKTAFNFVLVSYPDCHGIVTADADGQHLAADIKAVANTMLHDIHLAIVLGVREFDSSKVPLRSRLGNTVTITVFKFLTGVHIKDTQTGLRGLRRDILPELLRINSQGYEFELGMLLKVVRNGYALEQVPITTLYEPGNPTSHFNPLLDSLRIYFVFIRFCAAGVATYLSDLLVFMTLYSLGFSLFASVFCGRFGGAMVSFFLLRKFVFFSTEKLTASVIKFIAVWLVLLLLSYGSISLLVDQLGINIYASRIVVDVMLFLLNFGIQREFVFRKI